MFKTSRAKVLLHTNVFFLTERISVHFVEHLAVYDLLICFLIKVCERDSYGIEAKPINEEI